MRGVGCADASTTMVARSGIMVAAIMLMCRMDMIACPGIDTRIGCFKPAKGTVAQKRAGQRCGIGCAKQ